MKDQELEELRAYYLNMQHFLPIIEKHKKNAQQELVQKFKSGEPIERAAAKITVLQELETDAWSKVRKYESIK